MDPEAEAEYNEKMGFTEAGVDEVREAREIAEENRLPESRVKAAEFTEFQDLLERNDIDASDAVDAMRAYEAAVKHDLGGTARTAAKAKQYEEALGDHLGPLGDLGSLFAGKIGDATYDLSQLGFLADDVGAYAGSRRYVDRPDWKSQN